MISVIHNTYEKNIHICESATLNIKALEESGIDYQYIIFNDHGDVSIKQDIEHLLSNRVEYIYSDINYGMGVCSGGWVGAIPYLKGEYVHNIGQDDVYTATFYRQVISRLEDPNVYLAYANGFVVDDQLQITGQLMGPLQEMDYSEPKKVFNLWFNRQGDNLVSANNNIPAPGVIYKRELHNLIGEPDLQSFKGSADFEYWARALFCNMRVSYEPTPLWLYRMSQYSIGSKPETHEKVIEWNKAILKKYQQWLTQLLQEEQALSHHI